MVLHSTLQPLFGLIQTKLELITHAYFDEKDFSQVKLLEDTYKNLTISLTDGMKEASSMLLGNNSFYNLICL